jgi:Na+:H+ antiporter, NhaA family
MTLPRPLAFVIDNSLLLVAGTIAALVWANIDLDSYHAFEHALHFAVNDIGMVFFFALAAKEVYEATLPEGALSSPRQAAVPLFAAVGGMVAPAGLYLAQTMWLQAPELHRGWAVPCATDIAFSYMAARLMFKPRDPAIPFLLLLAIADDALGLIVLAVFYPSKTLSLPLFAILMTIALTLAWLIRRQRMTSYWPYVAIAGTCSWAALYTGGFHPALALVPIVPFMPHRATDPGLFVEKTGHDTLTRFEHEWKIPVQIVLGLFGLVNAGVPVSNVGRGTWVVLVSLVVGKPLGIALFTWLSERFGFQRAKGLTWRDVTVLGTLAGIGFTVALFFATAAFRPGDVLDQVKMGALLSFVAAPIGLLLGVVLRVGRAAKQATSLPERPTRVAL